MVALLPNAAHAAYTFSNVTSTSFTVNFVTNSLGGDASFGSTTDAWQCLVYESTGGHSVVGNYNGIAASVHSVSATGLQPNQTYIVECNDQTTLRVYQSGTTVQTLNAAPAFTLSSSSGDASMRVAYNGYTINSTGGVVSTWSISPALNNGLTFNTTTGLITGTPTTAQGRTTYTITGTNGVGTASQTFGLLIYAPLIDVQSASPNPVIFGSTLSVSGLNLDVATNAYIVYTDSLTQDQYRANFSSFLSQSQTSVTLQLPAKGGFLKSSGQYPYTQSANQVAPSGVSWSVHFLETGLNTQNQTEASVTINDTQASIIIAPAANSQIAATVGTPFTYDFSISGGTPPYTVVIAGGTLPSGLTMTSAGHITGTPTAAGTSTLTFTSQDSLLNPVATVSGVSIVVTAASVGTSVSAPDPVQQSKITGMSPNKAVAGDSVEVAVSGSFSEKVSAIQVNDKSLAAGSWKQTATTLTFTVSPSFSGVYSIQIYNGSAPVLAAQTLSVSPAPAAPKPASITRSRYIYLRCATASKKRIVYGTNPSCPVGYAKQ